MNTFDINQFHTLEEIVTAINNNNESGIQGFDYITPDFVAAHYAYASVKEAGYGIDKGTIAAHLDILKESGANFDYAKAIQSALMKI